MKRLASAGVRAPGRGSVQAEKAAALLTGGGILPEAYPLMRQVFSEVQRRALLMPAWGEPAIGEADPYTRLLEEAFGAELGDRGRFKLLRAISYAGARTYMHDVLLRDTDQMSMAYALEVRVPLLDHKLTEYVVGLPDRYKRANGTPKRLLVESLERLLPEEIVRRPKQGFVIPFERWMRGAFHSFCEQRLKCLGERGRFRQEVLDALWADFL